MAKNRRIAPLSFIAQEVVERKIYLIRGKKIMLDRDLASLYGVETRSLNQAVKRNLDRFPEDFMFQLTKDETKNWISQIVISNKERMGLRQSPYAFTEQGIAMLSSVLKSQRAVHANIQIMRTFTKIKSMLASNEMLRQRIEELEKKFEKHDKQFRLVFDAIREVLESPKPKLKKPIGFHVKY